LIRATERSASGERERGRERERRENARALGSLLLLYCCFTAAPERENAPERAERALYCCYLEIALIKICI
jgi:hypothetical protein